MTAQTPFGLGQIGSQIALHGHLEYALDPLNGADFLFYAPDMATKAAEMVADYARSAWAPRTVRIDLKTNLPAGHIIGLRHPVGVTGPYADLVLVVSPQGTEPQGISAETVDEIMDEFGF